MKSTIIRKPKFMRSETAMLTYMDVAKTIIKELDRPGLSTTGKYDLLMKLNRCFKGAAKAGGFFSVRDFLRWVDEHKNP